MGRLVGLMLALAAALTVGAPLAVAQQNEVTSEEVLSTLERAYGVHPGQPRNHTKGTCALGTFVGMPAVLWGVIQQATTGPVARPDRAVVVDDKDDRYLRAHGSPGNAT